MNNSIGEVGVKIQILSIEDFSKEEALPAYFHLPPPALPCPAGKCSLSTYTKTSMDIGYNHYSTEATLKVAFTTRILEEEATSTV